MNKQELLELMVTKLGLTKKEAEGKLSEIDGLVELLTSELEDGEKVKLGKYFTLELKEVAERSGEMQGKAYTTLAHKELVVKRTAICKDVAKIGKDK